jgi:hypothetical protein
LAWLQRIRNKCPWPSSQPMRHSCVQLLLRFDSLRHHLHAQRSPDESAIPAPPPGARARSAPAVSLGAIFTTSMGSRARWLSGAKRRRSYPLAMRTLHSAMRSESARPHRDSGSACFPPLQTTAATDQPHWRPAPSSTAHHLRMIELALGQIERQRQVALGNAAAQLCNCLHTASIVSRPSVMDRPVSSATPSIWRKLSTEPSGRRRRSSDSKPSSLPLFKR